MEKKTALRLMLIYSLLFMSLFTIFFVLRGNYEFLYYTALMLFVILFFVIFYKKFNFPVWSMFGLTVLLTLHILGGHVDVGNVRLYDFWIIPGVLKYDNPVHFLGIFTVTFMINHLIRPHLKKTTIKSTWFLYLITLSLGVAGFYEILELVPSVWLGAKNQVGDYLNNALDLVFGLLGSITAALIIVRKKR
ncbi:MAG: DUF2238 domain-containing protein [Candidatus Nanoarchaeia archaeon]|nr:DUF2238 domain-containing protein [Candidatus Nanoarchaeia archaeon]